MWRTTCAKRGGRGEECWWRWSSGCSAALCPPPTRGPAGAAQGRGGAGGRRGEERRKVWAVRRGGASVAGDGVSESEMRRLPFTAAARESRSRSAFAPCLPSRIHSTAERCNIRRGFCPYCTPVPLQCVSATHSCFAMEWSHGTLPTPSAGGGMSGWRSGCIAGHSGCFSLMRCGCGCGCGSICGRLLRGSVRAHDDRVISLVRLQGDVL